MSSLSSGTGKEVEIFGKNEYPVPVFVLSLPDEVPLLARTLSRTLPIQILKQLQKKQMSAGELASGLDVRLNTLTYNFEVLEKTGLIKVVQVKWSCKGRRVKVYGPAEQPVLLVLREKGCWDPFFLDTLEKTVENYRKSFSGRNIFFTEEPGKNDKLLSLDKKEQ